MPLDISTVSYLPGSMLTKIGKIQSLISKRFNTVRALDWELHVTIADRVMIPEEKLKETLEKLNTLCNNTLPIKVETFGIHAIEIPNSTFENPYVIAIGVKPTKELQEFHNKIQEGIFSGLEKGGYESIMYIPHITIAYKDLTKENFERAKEFLKENPFKANYNFLIDNLQLVVPSETEKMVSYKSFKLVG